jgi:hypothetical protein
LNAPPQILRFEGAVKCLPGPCPAGITLVGEILAPFADPVAGPGVLAPAQLSLICRETVTLPATLHKVSVEMLTSADIVLRAGGREWHIACQTWQLHRDVGAMFYTAIPPRPTPWARRLTWRVLLGVAATSPGRWLLLRRRRLN